MLHDKYYHLLEPFLGDYELKVYGRDLVGKVPMSHKTIALALSELEERSVLKSEVQGQIKHYSLNLKNSEIRDILAITELTRKLLFLSEHRGLAHLFDHDERMVGVFGSYAKSTQDKGSDIDLFVVGERSQDDYGEAGELLGLDVRVKYFREEVWRDALESKSNLWREIVKHHVMVFGVERFISNVWRHHYGLD